MQRDPHLPPPYGPAPRMGWPVLCLMTRSWISAFCWNPDRARRDGEASAEARHGAAERAMSITIDPLVRQGWSFRNERASLALSGRRGGHRFAHVEAIFFS